jgi:two-component system, NarL family, nitrate/nitrite response regulator NarL
MLPLTSREKEVLALVEQGMSDRKVARRLGYPVRTAKFHVSNLLHKHGVARRGELAVLLRRRVAGMCCRWE